MGIEVTRVDEDDRDTWQRAVEQSPQALPFHRLDVLETLADAADSRLHLLLGQKGERPVGLLPLFESRRGPLTLVRSPPTQLEVQYLGPLLVRVDELTEGKTLSWNGKFVDACVEWIDERLSPDLVDVRAHDRYADARPFLWNDFDVEPAYTYVLDLSPGTDALLEGLNRGVRSNVTNADAGRYEIAVGDERDVERVLSLVYDRLEEKGASFGLPVEVAERLYRTLPDGDFRPHVLRADGEVLGGQLTLYGEDTAYAWQAAADYDADLPVNDLVHWHVVRDAVERGYDRYDLVGAMNPGIARYKAKYNPEPRPVYLARRRSDRMRAVSAVRRRLPEGLPVPGAD